LRVTDIEIVNIVLYMHLKKNLFILYN